MRKHIAMIMLAVMMMVLAGCGGKGGNSDAPVVGDWKLSSVEAMGVTMDAEQFAQTAGGDIKMTINADGTFSMDLGSLYGDQSGEGKWEYKEPTLTLTVDGESITGDYADNKLTLNLEQGGQSVSMTFEK